MTTRTVHDAATLADALTASGVTEIVIEGTITGSPGITLPPGKTLRGGTLRFGAAGVRLTRDNTLSGIRIETADEETAVSNDSSVADLGTLMLTDVTTVGQILLVAEDAVRAGHVVVDGVHVERADLRGRNARPHGYGVDVMQGGLTIWNRQPDAAVVITAEVRGCTAGSAEHPVRGSGIFVGGHGDREGRGDGGVLRMTELRTGDVFTDGGIPSGTPDLISGGVFVVDGCHVDHVVTEGTTTTSGPNDMVLDNWGEVRSWTVLAPVVSNGPSGIGFVNFGGLGVLDVKAPIQTNGGGARGFNLYDGHIDRASFTDIRTTGDGSIGIQVSKPMGTITVSGDVTTTGARGTSLVKGVQLVLEAIGVSIKPGAVVEGIAIGGAVSTAGDGVTAVEIEGEVRRLSVGGGISATGDGSDAVHVTGDVHGLSRIALSSASGRALVRQAPTG